MAEPPNVTTRNALTNMTGNARRAQKELEETDRDINRKSIDDNSRVV